MKIIRILYEIRRLLAESIEAGLKPGYETSESNMKKIVSIKSDKSTKSPRIQWLIGRKYLYHKVKD